MSEEGKKKLTEEEFVMLGITKLVTEDRKSIHNVYSGFNHAFEQYFGKKSTDTLDALSKAGKIAMHPTKGGFRLYLHENRPGKRLDEVLAKIIAD